MKEALLGEDAAGSTETVEEPSEGANGGSSSSRAPPPPSPGRSSSGGINGKEHRHPTHPEAMTFPEEWEGEAGRSSASTLCSTSRRASIGRTRRRSWRRRCVLPGFTFGDGAFVMRARVRVRRRGRPQDRLPRRREHALQVLCRVWDQLPTAGCRHARRDLEADAFVLSRKGESSILSRLIWRRTRRRRRRRRRSCRSSSSARMA